MRRAIDEARWQEAQKAELAFWKGVDARTALDIAAEKPAFLAQLKPSVLVDLFKGKDVLEIGSGPLALSIVSFTDAKTDVRRLVKTDPLPRLLFSETRAGQQKWASALVSWLQDLANEGEYVQGPGEQLGLADSFDTVVSYNVLDHAQDPRAVLRNAYAALRSSGHLLLGVDCLSLVGRARFEQVTRRLRPNTTLVQCHPHSFTVGMVQQLITDAGFRLEGTFGVPGTFRRWGGRHSRPAFLAIK